MADQGPAPLEAVLCTEELQRRPARESDFAAENRALVALARALADAPQKSLQTLADTILQSLRAGSAGLTLLSHDGTRLRWPAIAGQWQPYVGQGTPRAFSVGGDVLDRDIPLLMCRPARRYPYLREFTPAIEECLMVPLHVGGNAVGFVWAMAHDEERRFDAEDLRLLQSLAGLAAAAVQAQAQHEPHAARRAALNLMEDAVHARQKMAAANAELRESELALRLADHRKDEFLAMLAHELRNPLAPIRNSVEILRRAAGPALATSTALPGYTQSDTPKRRRLDGAVQSAVQMMERQVSHMVRLIDDLLDVSRISRGKIDLCRSDVELAPLLQQSVEAARPQCERRDQQLALTLPDESVRLDADPARLTQIVGNLIHNACKFTERGGRIDVSARVEGEVGLEAEHEAEHGAEHEAGREAGRVARFGARRELVIRVRDDGIGIADDQLERIFQMFAQVDASVARSSGGLGIGLSLVRDLATLHGGSVAAHSAGIGQGSEFEVRLPIVVDVAATSGTSDRPELVLRQAQDDRPQAQRERNLRSSQPQTPAAPILRILVVDDNRDAAQSLADLLQLGGHETILAHDGIEAVDAAAAFRPDVILLDIGLPRIDGYEAGRRIRAQDGQGRKRPLLVALTGWGQDEDRRRSAQAGFDAHLVKPVATEALMKLLS